MSERYNRPDLAMPRYFFRQLSAGVIGGCIGGALAFSLEEGGYSPLAIYVLLGSWLGAWLATITIHAKYFRISQNKATKTLLVALLTGAYFGIENAFNINPRDLVYLPLVPLVIVSTLFFGFEYGFLVTILSTAIADYFYVPAIQSLKVDHWEDAIGLVTFVIAGSLLAFGTSNVFSPKK
jgi:uncharacterized membrane protein YeaQ/YmgE (transglycosylase-associated protein family)